MSWKSEKNRKPTVYTSRFMYHETATLRTATRRERLDDIHGNDGDVDNNATTAITIAATTNNNNNPNPRQHYPEQHKKRLADKLNVKVCRDLCRQFQTGVAWINLASQSCMATVFRPREPRIPRSES